ncbi:MAG: hypothetical protein ACE5DM_05625, partial [Candidatus Nanoarchaeia archaeon]
SLINNSVQNNTMNGILILNQSNVSIVNNTICFNGADELKSLDSYFMEGYPGVLNNNTFCGTDIDWIWYGWYFQASVNWTSGNPVNHSNVTVFGQDAQALDSDLTNGTGYTSLMPVPEYIYNSTERVNKTPQDANATKYGATNQTSTNITISRMLSRGNAFGLTLGGSLNVSLVTPSASTTFALNNWSEFTINVTCVSGYCGDTNVTLDPFPSLIDGKSSLEITGAAASDPGSQLGSEAGSLQVVTIPPFNASDYEVIFNRSFKVSVNVTCLSAPCGNVSVTLDPKIYNASTYSVLDVGGTDDYVDYDGNGSSSWVGSAWLFTNGSFSGTCYNITLSYDNSHSWSSRNYSAINESGLTSTGYPGEQVEYLFEIYNNFTECEASQINPTKGIIPINAGSPYYTTSLNPRNATDDTCLDDVQAGESCVITWTVMPNTSVGSQYNFFAYANSTNDLSDRTGNTSVTVASEVIINLSNSATWLGRIVERDGDLYLLENITLETQTYLLNKTLILNASDVHLNCSGAGIAGNGSGVGLFANDKDGLVLTNCTVYDYAYSLWMNNSNVTSSDLVIGKGAYINGSLNATNLTFYNTTSSIIYDSIILNNTNTSRDIELSSNYIWLNSIELPELNRSSRLVFNDLWLGGTVNLLKDGVSCEDT